MNATWVVRAHAAFLHIAAVIRLNMKDEIKKLLKNKALQSMLSLFFYEGGVGVKSAIGENHTETI